MSYFIISFVCLFTINYNIFQDDYKIPGILNFLTSQIGMKAGKGGPGSKAPYRIWHDIPEGKVDQKLTSSALDSPFLVLFFKNDTFELGAITVDTKVIYCQANSILDALLLLLASYYVFDLHYPRPYSQALGFLQQEGLKKQFVEKKSSGFAHLLAKCSD